MNPMGNQMTQDQFSAAYEQLYADRLPLLMESQALYEELRLTLNGCEDKEKLDLTARFNYVNFLLKGEGFDSRAIEDLSTNMQLLQYLKSGEVDDAVEFFEKKNTPLSRIQMYLLEIARAGKDSSDAEALVTTCGATFLQCVKGAPAENRSGFPFRKLLSTAARWSSDTVTAALTEFSEGPISFENNTEFKDVYHSCLRNNFTQSLELLEGLPDYDRFSFKSSGDVEFLCRIYDRRDGQFERLGTWIEKGKFDLGTKIEELSVMEFIVNQDNLELFEDILDRNPELVQDEEEEKLIKYIEENTKRSVEFISAIYKKLADGVKTGEAE